MDNLREVQLILKSNGGMVLIPIDEIITQEKYGWWVHEKTMPGGAHDGVGDFVKVRDITAIDTGKILDNKGKCFVEVNYEGILSTPSNIKNKKIVIRFNK